MSLANDLPQAVPVLEDPVSLEGQPLNKVLEGDAAALKNALAALIAKDAAGNLQYPRVNAQNELVVSTTSNDYACLGDTAKVAGDKVTEQLVLTIPLSSSLEYDQLFWKVACFRQAEFRLVWVDDVGGTPVETELDTTLVGPNQYTFGSQASCMGFTTTANTCELRVYGINYDTASDLRATVYLREKQES